MPNKSLKKERLAHAISMAAKKGGLPYGKLVPAFAIPALADAIRAGSPLGIRIKETHDRERRKLGLSPSAYLRRIQEAAP